jgi:hypothetical protein
MKMSGAPRSKGAGALAPRAVASAVAVPGVMVLALLASPVRLAGPAATSVNHPAVVAVRSASHAAQAMTRHRVAVRQPHLMAAVAGSQELVAVLGVLGAVALLLLPTGGRASQAAAPGALVRLPAARAPSRLLR